MALHGPRLAVAALFRPSCFLKSNFRPQIASAAAKICSKEMMDPDIVKPEPWPYKTKKFTYWHGYWENTMKRFDENTKIIVVDGNIGVGKSSFAKELAEKLDMLYVPEPSMEKAYITSYGYDLRELNPIFPPSFKIVDLKTYYNNPLHRNVTMFQYKMFMLRYESYIDSLAHLLNTGQGIVMERSVYGDFVFLETMHKMGYVKKAARDYYMEIYEECVVELMRPHLLIYLDITPETALERIKQRNNPDEANSKVLTKEYLETIEYYYKQHYLKALSKHAELLIYDWSNYGDVEVVIEDVERIDFDRFNKYHTKMKDWVRDDDWEWGYLRRLYTNYKRKLLMYASIPKPSITEVYHPSAEMHEYLAILAKVPGTQFVPGFNPDMGDNVLFKLFNKGYWNNYNRFITCP